MKTIDEKLAVMRGWLEGKQIHNKAYVDLLWSIDNFPEWDFEYYDYRIKPEPTGSERVIELLKQGKPVLCCESSISQEHADKHDQKHYSSIVKMKDSGWFTNSKGVSCPYVSPVDLSQFAQESK